MSPARFTAEQVAQCWRDALALWDVRTQLSPPEPHVPFDKELAPGNEPLAYIDMVKRQVFVNFELLANMGAAGSLMAVLAHEIGHHVRFPHTLGWDAELRALEQRLIPGLKQSLTNLFFDLQVNEVVGRTHAEDLCAVYRGFLSTQAQTQVSPLFFFYLVLYEELWARLPGDLTPKAQLESMEKAFPGYRAEAKMFVQTFYALTDMRLQFLYFCATFIRYIEQPHMLDFLIPLAGDVPMPDEGDLDAAVHGGGAWEEALDEARERGWLSETHDTKDPDPL
ncbi:MAG TPA: M48 family metalloprotease, partial [Myxococcaceae bacterium]